MNQVSISARVSVLLGLTTGREEPKAIVETVISELLQVYEESVKPS